MVNSLENRTLSEIINEVTTAYLKTKFDLVTVTIYDESTGLPISGAIVRVYDEPGMSYYIPESFVFQETTSSNG
jgi:hypothetical protein